MWRLAFNLFLFIEFKTGDLMNVGIYGTVLVLYSFIKIYSYLLSNLL